MGVRSVGLLLILILVQLVSQSVISPESILSEFHDESSPHHSSTNNSSGNTTTPAGSNRSITIISPMNGSSVHTLPGARIHYQVENYTGTGYWNVTALDTFPSNGSNYNGTAYFYSNNNGQGQGQGQGNWMNLPLVDGNYTVCLSLPTGESDCVTYLHSFIQTSVRIVSVSNNETFMDYAGNSTRISIEVENYSGFITWNWTNEDTMNRPQYNSTTYANGWVTTVSSGRTLEEGNHSLCVTLSTNETDCVSFRVLHHPHAFLITEPADDSFVYVRNTSNGPVLDASFTVTNYSGTVSWSLASLTRTNPQSTSWIGITASHRVGIGLTT